MRISDWSSDVCSSDLLSTVYGIVKQTGGYVFVDSTVGAGTTFAIFLPAVAEVEVAATLQEVDAQERRDLTGAGTLLLVEDEDAVRAFSARALRNKGYHVLEATYGQTPPALLAHQEDPIALLVTDMVIPAPTGPPRDR